MLIVCVRVAVGATFGWRAAQNPRVRVSVVCRSNFEAVKAHGLQMRTSAWGSGMFQPHRVARTPQELEDVEFDYVVCAQKAISRDQHGLSEMLRHVVRPQTTLVTAQNGLGAEAPLRGAFFGNTILSAICYVGCTQSSPGVVDQVAQIRPHAFHIGNYDNICTDSALDQVKLQKLVRMDPMFKAVDDINAERWTKLIFNGSWNPITALTGLDTHGLIRQGSSTAMLMVSRLAKEIYKVASSSGVVLPSDLPSRTLSSAREAAPIVPSMLQDVRKKRPMEIEALCGECCLRIPHGDNWLISHQGNIWRHADKVGVPVPTIKATYRMLKQMNDHLNPHPAHMLTEQIDNVASRLPYLPIDRPMTQTAI